MTTKSTPATGKTDNGTGSETDPGAGESNTGEGSETDTNGGTDGTPTEEDGRLKKLRKDLDAKTARIAELEAAEEERRRQEMSESERLAAERDEAIAERDRLRSEALRSRIASEFGLSADLADRLKGDTEDDLRTDAEALAALVGKPTDPPPPSPDDAGIGGKGDAPVTDPVAMHRAATAGYGI